MSKSIRIFLGSKMGRVKCNFGWSRINKNSALVITAAEHDHNVFDYIDLDTLTAPPGAPQQSESDVKVWQKGRPHLGDADVYVTNIGPHGDQNEAGGVEFYLHVDHYAPVNVMVSIPV